MNSKLTIRIVRPSSREQTDLLGPRLEELRKAGFDVLYDDLPRDPNWAYVAAPTAARVEALTAALTERGTDAVLCARGGYGASDMLPLLPWERLRNATPKLLIGFSDISALHAALAAKLGWPSLHAPMPATVLWRAEDLHTLASLLAGLRKGTAEFSLPVEPVSGHAGQVEGALFGGCFTVLTNLIATPYLPALDGKLVFIEDTDEHPARLMRAFNLWVQAGLLAKAKALVVGHLRNLGDKIPDCAPFVYERFAQISPVPVYKTQAFGHTSPNQPLLIGATATVAGDGRTLTWRHSQA
jgi:muramoyltetrapeptide carboxypeptidase